MKAEKLEWTLEESNCVLSTGSSSSSYPEEVEMSVAAGNFVTSLEVAGEHSEPRGRYFAVFCSPVNLPQKTDL